MVHAAEDLGTLRDVAGHHLARGRRTSRAACIRLVPVDALVIGTQQPIAQQVIHVHYLGQTQIPSETRSFCARVV